MESYTMEWDRSDIPGAIAMGFNYVEAKDEIVGIIAARPEMLKEIVLAMPSEIKFDYIPDGIGILRTAYLKRSFIRGNEIRFKNQQDTINLRLFLR